MSDYMNSFKWWPTKGVEWLPKDYSYDTYEFLLSILLYWSCRIGDTDWDSSLMIFSIVEDMKKKQMCEYYVGNDLAVLKVLQEEYYDEYNKFNKGYYNYVKLTVDQLMLLEWMIRHIRADLKRRNEISKRQYIKK